MTSLCWNRVVSLAMIHFFSFFLSLFFFFAVAWVYFSGCLWGFTLVICVCASNAGQKLQCCSCGVGSTWHGDVLSVLKLKSERCVLFPAHFFAWCCWCKTIWKRFQLHWKTGSEQLCLRSVSLCSVLDKLNELKWPPRKWICADMFSQSLLTADIGSFSTAKVAASMHVCVYTLYKDAYVSY